MLNVLEHQIWSICGDVLNEEKFATRILKCLRKNGYTVYPIMNKEHEGIYTNFKSMPKIP